jgi:hypothetical protein
MAVRTADRRSGISTANCRPAEATRSYAAGTRTFDGRTDHNDAISDEHPRAVVAQNPDERFKVDE